MRADHGRRDPRRDPAHPEQQAEPVREQGDDDDAEQKLLVQPGPERQRQARQRVAVQPSARRQRRSGRTTCCRHGADHQPEHQREHERLAEHRRERARADRPAALIAHDQTHREADHERHEDQRTARAQHPREESRQQHVGAVAHDAARRADRRDEHQQLVQHEQGEREEQTVAMRSTRRPVLLRLKSCYRDGATFQKSIPPAC